MSAVKFDVNQAKKHRQDFPALGRKLRGRPLAFFDGPGGTQTPTAVIEAVSEYYRRGVSNTHGAFETSRETDEMLQSARTALAEFLGAPSWKCVSFGANTTTLAFALAHALAKDMREGDEILITELDHEANRGPWLNLTRYGVTVKEVRLLPSGELDYEDMAAKMSDRTRALAIGMSSNALGTANDIATARKLSKEAGALLILDAVHYAPHYPLDAAGIDADFLICSAYKFYGPHVGILYSKPGLLDSLRTDSLSVQSQEAPYRIETGTLNHASIAGALAAVNYIASLGEGTTRREKIVSAMTGIYEYEHGLASRYYDAVGRMPGVRVWGPDFNRHRMPTVSVTTDGATPAEAAQKLGEHGLMLWDGDFYAGKAIEALGLKDSGGVLRAGMSLYNTAEEVDWLIEAVETLTAGS
jgi:cysteine desulfurase family protein (TIGR01976 family)